MPTDILSTKKDYWGQYGKDWVWENDPIPENENLADWVVEDDWCWEDECLNEIWGKEGEDWEWYDGYFTCDDDEEDEE